MQKDGALLPDVLGSKASTLPRDVPNYSNTKLGHWSRLQDAQVAQASKVAQATLGGKPLLSAGAKAATRVTGPVLDAMIGALDLAVYAGFSATLGLDKLEDNLKKKGIKIYPEERLHLRGHLARGDIEAANDIIREAAIRSQK